MVSSALVEDCDTYESLKGVSAGMELATARGGGRDAERKVGRGRGVGTYVALREYVFVLICRGAVDPEYDIVGLQGSADEN